MMITIVIFRTKNRQENNRSDLIYKLFAAASAQRSPSIAAEMIPPA